MASPTKADPSRTTVLRRQFERDIRRRLRLLKKDIKKFLVEDDQLGLVPRTPQNPTNLVANRRDFAFHTDAEKITEFRSWLQERIDKRVLLSDRDPPWVSEYIDSAYRRGVTRSFTEARREALAESADFMEGTKREFLQSAFNAPETTRKLQSLYTRTFNELEGVTGSMGSQISRVLTDGLAEGRNPNDIARTMSNSIDKIERTRARVIARTEIIRVHAEGQLDGFERLGVEEVGIQAEWSTAGDERVCAECAAMEGTTLTIAEARNLIPLHPQCRCAWLAAEPSKIKKSKKTLRRDRNHLKDKKEDLIPDNLDEEGKLQEINKLSEEGIQFGNDGDPGDIKFSNLQQFQREWGMNPRKAKRVLLRGMDDVGKPQMNFRINDDGTWRVHGRLASGGFGNRMNMEFRRTVDLRSSTRRVSHDLLEFSRSKQGQGIGKTFGANQMEMWDHLGIDEIKLHANIDVGGYAWAKYGFTPEKGEWDSWVKMFLEDTIDERIPLDNPVRGKMLDLIKSDDPKVIRKIAAFKEPVNYAGKQQAAGKAVLLNTDWQGGLDLTNEEDYSIFMEYVSKR